MADVKAVIGDIDNVNQLDELLCMINAAPDFSQQSQVANGATALLSQPYGAAAGHARCGPGMASLPNGACIGIGIIIDL